MLKTQVLIIGGGITGAGIVRDLTLRGIECILAEKSDINAGASGANHGLLHSGARYVAGDLVNAKECREEGNILKKLAPHCVEDTGGLFVAVEGDDEKYVADFPGLCSKCGIPTKDLDIKEVLEMEPSLSDKLIAAYQVPDAAVDPFKLSLDNIYQALDLGSTLLRHSKVTGFTIKKNRILVTKLQNMLTGEQFNIEAVQVVNAAGAWAKEVAALAGCTINLLYSKGSLLVTHNRIAQRVINRLRPSSNADILVPGGTVSILGTTSVTIDTLDQVFPTVEETDYIVSEATAMIPQLERTRFIRAYAGVRPLLGTKAGADDRSVSRGFSLIDHLEDGLENFASITGGKLSTYRLMAEKTANLICNRLGVSRPCLTRTDPLTPAGAARWTKPGLAPKVWMKQHDPEDIMLCECEMVPKSVVDSIVESIHKQNGKPDLKAIGLRSRIGKGACQGTFCGLRTCAYLYDTDELQADEGLTSLREFVNERWRGVRPLLWDTPLIQAELQEALYCGLMGIEL
ncbi:MAG: anaerobic glycerol-3-phosphate dehydrogenase subunit GlpA [Thermodesulfobacteriota bacterium]|nr:anaerobic glycerol-3-phosphate dehydrogenase subunit GlpA [Thermodesulfobacteriota bacterium]